MGASDGKVPAIRSEQLIGVSLAARGTKARSNDELSTLEGAGKLHFEQFHPRGLFLEDRKRCGGLHVAIENSNPATVTQRLNGHTGKTTGFLNKPQPDVDIDATCEEMGRFC